MGFKSLASARSLKHSILSKSSLRLPRPFEIIFLSQITSGSCMKFAFLAKSDCFDPKLPTKKNTNGTNEVKHKKIYPRYFSANPNLKIQPNIITLYPLSYMLILELEFQFFLVPPNYIDVFLSSQFFYNNYHIMYHSIVKKFKMLNM